MGKATSGVATASGAARGADFRVYFSATDAICRPVQPLLSVKVRWHFHRVTGLGAVGQPLGGRTLKCVCVSRLDAKRFKKRS